MIKPVVTKHSEAVDKIHKDLKGKVDRDLIDSFIKHFFGRNGVQEAIRSRKNFKIPFLGSFKPLKKR